MRVLKTQPDIVLGNLLHLVLWNVCELGGLPTFNASNRGRTSELDYFQVYHFKKAQRNSGVYSISPHWQIVVTVKFRAFTFSTVQLHVIVNSVPCWHKQCHSRFMDKAGRVFVSLSFSKQDLRLFLMLTKLGKQISFYPLRWVNIYYYCHKHNVTNNCLWETGQIARRESHLEIKNKGIFSIEEGNSIQMQNHIEKATLWSHVVKARNMIVWCLPRAQQERRISFTLQIAVSEEKNH